MKWFVWVFNVLFAILILPLLLPHWVVCRLTAKTCPQCGERWLTELVGEWAGEDWHCLSCNFFWTVE